MSPRRRATLIGIRRRGAGWQALVRVDGTLHQQTFPLHTPIESMQAWRAQMKRAHQADAPGTLAHDVPIYLRTVAHLPDARNRRGYLARWLDAIGPSRSRYSVTTPELNAIMAGWLKPTDSTVKPLAPVTVRHHRSCLLDLYRALDPFAPNPVTRTFRPKDPLPQNRAVPLDQVWAILDRMRPWSKNRARLLLILTTGLPHAQIRALTPADWDRQRQTLRVTARKKGGGAHARLLPLSDAATDALTAFDRADAWGAFSSSSLHSAVAGIARRNRLTPWSPYQLRHTHATLLYQSTGDLATVARLLGHSGTQTTLRYTQEAWLEVDRAAQEKVGIRLTRTDPAGGESRHELPQELPTEEITP